jgi:hypothetical protein
LRRKFEQVVNLDGQIALFGNFDEKYPKHTEAAEISYFPENFSKPGLFRRFLTDQAEFQRDFSV